MATDRFFPYRCDPRFAPVWGIAGVRPGRDGLTFGTSTKRGVCIHFHEPVPQVLGFKDHSALTVTVDDCDGLVEAIGEDQPGPGAG